MCNKKLISGILAAALTVGFTGCRQSEAQTAGPDSAIVSKGRFSQDSNLYTHLNDSQKSGELEGMTLDGYELLAENENLALYLRKASASIRVVDRKSGYVWGALREDQPKGIEVSVTEEAVTELTEPAETENAEPTEAETTEPAETEVTEPEATESTEATQPAEPKATEPTEAEATQSVQTEKLGNLNKTWSSFANSIVSIKYYDKNGGINQIGAGHSDNKCTYEAANNGITIHVEFSKIGISLSATVELKEDHIRFSLDDSSIKETSDNLLGEVYFAPFLGSTIGDEISGYMFVPDGSGALIRFQRPIKYVSGYSDRVYGSDYSIDNTYTSGDLNANRTNDFLKDREAVTMPVYGISHGYDAHALFGYVERGAEYSAILAEPAGDKVHYNYASAYFIYRQVYSQPTGRDDSGIQMVQKKANLVNPALNVYFLNGEQANYTGMAHLYRGILEAQGILPGAAVSEPALMLDYIVADVCEGFLVNTTTSLTNAEQLKAAAAYLQEKGISSVSFQLMGWQSGGLNGYQKLKSYDATELGSLQELAALRETLTAMGYDLSMYLAPFSTREGQVIGEKDYGIALSQAVIEIKRNNETVFLGDVQYVKIRLALETLKQQLNTLYQAGLTSVAIDEAAELLYSEMLLNEEMSRTQVMQLLVSKLTELAGEKGLTLYSPNAYLLGVTSVYRDVPMSGSRYAFETDSVPFLQIVLSGSMTMYAPYANQSFYTDMDVLKCIEYNAYPSFLMTGSDSKSLSGTPSQEFFSTSFEDWKATAVAIYQKIDGVLSHVQGQKMLSHTVLQEGVVCVGYESGCVYVNYTDEPYTAEGVTVEGASAVYVKTK